MGLKLGSEVAIVTGVRQSLLVRHHALCQQMKTEWSEEQRPVDKLEVNGES